MIHLIIDTNVCLHFTSLDEYPWSVQFKDEKEITLVITHPLIEELDKKKYSGKNHLKDRATKVLKIIEKYEGQVLKNKCKLYLFNENVNKDYVESLGLDNSDGDDRMLASIVKFKELGNENIILVTNDLGPRLKAKKFKIDNLIPNSSYQLENPEDELEKDIKNLKRENERLKNLIPKLSVTFKNGENLEKYEIIKFTKKREEFLEYEMIEIKRKHPTYLTQLEEDNLEEKIQSHAIKQIRASLINTSRDLWISKEAKEEYNLKLLDFYRDYENYLSQVFNYKIQSSLIIDVLLQLNNSGTCPADDIDIYFHFPDGFELFGEMNYPPEPLIPSPPEKPRSLFDPISPPLMLYNAPLNQIEISSEFPDMNVSEPIIRKTNSYDVEVHVGKLKHNQSVRLDKMLVVFNDYESIRNFKVNYELKCSNVPDVIPGTLNFRVEKL